MSDIADADKPAFWCHQFIDELYANGLRHVVISPGSRSTPLAFAFDTHKGFTKTVILDERSAAFVGLGIAKSTGIPAALVCTSGTAAANYFPAIVEARQSETPLLVLTADRPPKQRFTGSSQTIDQIKLFGDYPLLFHDAGEPVLKDEDISRLRFLACQAASASIDQGGPVHINFPFRKPLEPGRKVLEMLEKKSIGQIQQGHPPIVKTLPPKNAQNLPDEVADLMERSQRPVIIAGPRPAHLVGGDTILKLGKQLNAPVLAESSSQVNGPSSFLIRGYDAFLRRKETRKGLEPDLIIHFGNEPVSKGLELLVKECAGIPHIHLFESDRPQNASLTLNLRSRAHLPSLSIPHFQRKSDAFLKKWQRHSGSYKKSLMELFDQDYKLSDPHVYFDLVSLIPDNLNIILSNSFPVRDFDAFGMFENPGQPVFVNRGAAGIDGITSTAIGCNMGNKRGGVLFTGDLAFLHDSNALLQAFSREQALVIVVINNSGGSIFKMLPFEEQDERFNRLFETPQQVNFASLAKAHNIDFISVKNRGELKPAFQELSRKPGISILECVTDSADSMKIRKNIWK
ncbi:MAG: 2-succinyl-5-enolpyruvyl-6-hydroxy-3-cyclohexene-1-carboxylic-acid synthase [Balneolales bacterium]